LRTAAATFEAHVVVVVVLFLIALFLVNIFSPQEYYDYPRQNETCYYEDHESSRAATAAAAAAVQAQQ
jgi:hypothetical protein